MMVNMIMLMWRLYRNYYGDCNDNVYNNYHNEGDYDCDDNDNNYMIMMMVSIIIIITITLHTVVLPSSSRLQNSTSPARFP